jgi:hypothetical protein
VDAKTHWEKVYTTKPPEAVSWYRAHLEKSLSLIQRAARARSDYIIDIGAGESTLVDDLLAGGYENITGSARFVPGGPRLPYRLLNMPSAQSGRATSQTAQSGATLGNRK